MEGRDRTRVVVLGSGWAAATFVKNLSSKLTGQDGWYDVRVISPRWVQAPFEIAKKPCQHRGALACGFTTRLYPAG